MRNETSTKGASCETYPRRQAVREFEHKSGFKTTHYTLRTWLDSWAGVGRVVVGMARQGFDLQLTRYDEKGWRATVPPRQEEQRNNPGEPARSEGEVMRRRHSSASFHYFVTHDAALL